MSHQSEMQVPGKSDGRVVPRKGPNSEGRPLGEGLEGRRPARENLGQTAATRTPSRTEASRGLDGVREAARQDKEVRFTALLHHVTVDLLRASYDALKKQAAPGGEGVTWPRGPQASGHRETRRPQVDRF